MPRVTSQRRRTTKSVVGDGRCHMAVLLLKENTILGSHALVNGDNTIIASLIHFPAQHESWYAESDIAEEQDEERGR